MKLEIIGPYTPDHPGPFCKRDGMPVRILTRTDGEGPYPIVGFVGDGFFPTAWTQSGHAIFGTGPLKTDLMNAREVPVAREFWISGELAFYTKRDAVSESHHGHEVIHVREVMPEDDE